MTGESLLAGLFELLFPVAQELLADAELACRLGTGIALLGDEPECLDFEFPRKRSP
jgi:hypothetical protein